MAENFPDSPCILSEYLYVYEFCSVPMFYVLDRYTKNYTGFK